MQKVKRLTYEKAIDIFEYVREQYFKGNYPNKKRELKLINTVINYKIGFVPVIGGSELKTNVLVSEKELLIIIKKNILREITKKDAVYLIRDKANERLKRLSKLYEFEIKHR